MFKTLLTAAFCVTAITTSMADDNPVGRAFCAPHQKSSACAIQWDFVAAPRGFYQVEYLDEHSLTWRTSGSPYSAFHSRSQPVQPERLYRVRGCDDEAMSRHCVASTVQWAIARPKTDEIPQVLVDGNGHEMYVVKSAPKEVQIAQYNVYRLVQLLDRIPDLSQLPPMTKPQVPNGPVAGYNEDYNILSGIYENYSERRRQAIHVD
jgi:hypothetical protein